MKQDKIKEFEETNRQTLIRQYIEMTNTQYWEFVAWVHKDQSEDEKHQEELE